MLPVRDACCKYMVRHKFYRWSNSTSVIYHVTGTPYEREQLPRYKKLCGNARLSGPRGKCENVFAQKVHGGRGTLYKAP
jgi:hypothetical protein